METQNNNQNNTENQQQTENKNTFEFDFNEIQNTSHFNPQENPDNKMHHHLISIAPMLDVTNPHWRFLFRLVSRHSTLYTEMIHANTIIHATKPHS